MRVDLRFLVEQTDVKKPDWIPDETWNGMDSKDKEKMAKTEETIANIKNQDKNVTQTSPGSDSVKDFLNKVDEWGRQARETGQEIGDVRNRELAKDPNYGQRIPTATDPTTGRSDTSSTVLAPNTSVVGGHLTTVVGTPEQFAQAKAETEARAKARAEGKNKVEWEPDPERPGLQRAKLSPEEAKAREDRKAGQKAVELEWAKRRQEKLATRSGKVTLPDGQVIDMDELKKADPSNREVQRQLGLLQRQWSKEDAAQREAEAEATKQKNRAVRERNMKVTAVQAEVAKDSKFALGLGGASSVSPPKQAQYSDAQQPQQTQNNNSTTQTGEFGKNQQPAVPTPTNAPAVPAPTSATGQPLSPRSSPPSQIPSSVSGYGGSYVFPSPMTSRTPEDKIQIRAMANAAKAQPILTTGLANRGMSGLNSYGQGTDSTGDVRYKTMRATKTGPQAVAETFNFNRGELKVLLEAPYGSPFGGPSGMDWWKQKISDIGTAIKTKQTSTGKTVKRTPSIAIRDVLMGLNPLQFAHPQDRWAFTPSQTGYSKAKAERTIQHMLSRPGLTNIIATAAGAPSPELVRKGIGLAQTAIAGPLLTSKSKALRQIGSGINLGGNILQNIAASAGGPGSDLNRARLAASIIGDVR